MFQKRLHRPTFDKIDMAYIKTPCRNRDIVKVLKRQWLRDGLDGRVALTLRDRLLFGGGRVPADAHPSETGTGCLSNEGIYR